MAKGIPRNKGCSGMTEQRGAKRLSAYTKKGK